MRPPFCILYSSLCLLLLGCGCSTTRQFPLQPGEKIIFNDAARANAFRAESRNDTTNTGRVVTIGEPVRLNFDQ
jgi:hypothetical protein